MIVAMNAKVLVITAETTVEPALEQIAIGRGWPLMVRPSRSELLREVRQIQPKVLLFQSSASDRLDEALTLISTARACQPDIPRVVLAFAASDGLEARVRAAGAGVYLRVGDSAENLDTV